MLDSLLDEQEDFSSQTSMDAEGLNTPCSSYLCLGFEKQEQQILELYESNHMPHALIFSGPKGIGKSTFAYRVARFLLKNGIKGDNNQQDSLFGDALPSEPVTSLDVSKDDPVFAKIAAGGHSDFLAIERQIDPRKGTLKAALDVDTIRKVTPFLRMTASDGGWRVVIIDDADTMNRNSQNALLKILEEPPKNTILILITHRIGAMIPTIRSRCRTINFKPLSNENMDILLNKVTGNDLSNDDKAMILSMAEGQISKAIDLYEQEGLEIFTQLLSITSKWPDIHWTDVHHLADQLGRRGQENAYDAFEQSFLWLVNTLTIAKAKNITNLNAPLNQGVFTSMMAHYSLEKWLGICEELNQHFKQAKFANLNKAQAVLRAFSYLKA